MKGLLLKDAYVVCKLCKMFILIDVLFIALSIIDHGNLFFLFYPCLVSGMMPLTLLSYDVQEKWNQYAEVLPYTRAQRVSSKYLIGLCGSFITMVVCAAALAFSMVRNGTFVTETYLVIVVLLLSASLLVSSILYFLVFRFGVEKGRIINSVGIVVACFLGSVFTDFGTGFAAVKISTAVMLAAIFAGTALLYAGSWLLSIRLYEKREL